MEGTESPAQALHETDHGRQGSEEDRDGSRTRTAWLYLGDCHQGRANLPTTNCCMKDKNKNLPNRKKAKTLNHAIKLEDKVSRSRSSHEVSSLRRNHACGRTALCRATVAPLSTAT